MVGSILGLRPSALQSVNLTAWRNSVRFVTKCQWAQSSPSNTGPDALILKCSLSLCWNLLILMPKPGRLNICWCRIGSHRWIALSSQRFCRWKPVDGCSRCSTIIRIFLLFPWEIGCFFVFVDDSVHWVQFLLFILFKLKLGTHCSVWLHQDGYHLTPVDGCVPENFMIGKSMRCTGWLTIWSNQN